MRLIFKAMVVSILVFLFVPIGCAKDPKSEKQGDKMQAAVENLELKSSVFKAGEMIPRKHTCDGEDISPQLSWGKTPDGTKELVLICDDPDAPMGTWVHWVIYGMPSSTTGLTENFPKKDTAQGAVQGKNSFGKVGYGGPCPPHGSTHRYYFKLYAIDKALNLNPKATKDEVTKAIEGHILAKGELMGRYGR
jgi:Raf kinase inhibitor-like YbhB/YbcL family protein